MIVIKREYDVPDSRGGGYLHEVTRKVFEDKDIEGIQSFLDERAKVSGYEWKNISFEYTKL